MTFQQNIQTRFLIRFSEAFGVLVLVQYVDLLLQQVPKVLHLISHTVTLNLFTKLSLVKGIDYKKRVILQFLIKKVTQILLHFVTRYFDNAI